MMTPKQNSPLVTQFSVNPTKKYDIGVYPPISMMTVLPAVQLVTLIHEFVPGNKHLYRLHASNQNPLPNKITKKSFFSFVIKRCFSLSLISSTGSSNQHHHHHHHHHYHHHHHDRTTGNVRNRNSRGNQR